MTREEIQNMSAGREMDALIAEKIFGWSWNGNFLLPPSDHPASVNHWCAEWDDDGRPHWLPNYSTDLTTAWEVVEKIGEWRGFEFLMRRYCMSEKQWQAGWFEDGYDGYETRVSAESELPALSICRAALLAVMEAE